MLAESENFAGLARLNRELIARAEAVDPSPRVVLDMDSTEIPVHGQQEQSAYNGHFESTCYHPLLLFDRAGDCLAAKLRSGNVHSADGWEEMLLPEIERQQKLGKEVVVRADAAFAKPEIYEALEERGVKYAIRIPANDSLERDIAELLPRPVGRPSIKPLIEYKSFLYQAASWGRARRVVAKVEHHRGELSNTEEATGCIVVATRSQNGNLAFGVRLVSLKSRDAALSSTAHSAGGSFRRRSARRRPESRQLRRRRGADRRRRPSEP